MTQLAQRDFQRFAAFIHSTAGIKMPPSKRTMVEGRLRRRVRALGLDSFEDYARFVFDDGGLEGEAVAIIDALTTNKTEFFREPDHFRHLTEAVLPAHRGERPLKVWSSACSNGAEPYTLAMVLAEHARMVSGFRAQVVATDICTEVLEKAALAIYPESAIAPV
ncbi:MAG: CheR family methyltransferase, partial [Pseudomonadota bacterium]